MLSVRLTRTVLCHEFIDSGAEKLQHHNRAVHSRGNSVCIYS